MSHPTLTEHLAHRAVERTVARRRLDYEREMGRIVESTFALIDRTGTVDPPMREILAEAGLSTQAFYRYFTSKDELMLALLDDGRRRLLTSLGRRMQRSSTPADRVRAWVEGVLAQATDPSAASRTRPWVLSEQRLAELFPGEQQASVDLLIGLLDDPVAQLWGPSAPGGGDVDDRVEVAGRVAAVMVYRLTFATLRSHLVERTAPTVDEIDALVGFCLRGATR